VVRVLIVDDDEGIRDALADILSDAGQTPLMAPNGLASSN